MTLKQLSYILLLLILCSCEREFKLDSNSHEKRPVVNSILSSDSTISVNLSYSAYFTDTIFDPIDHAEVKVIDLTDNKEYKLLNIGNGDYQSDISGVSSHDYRLEIDGVTDDLVTAKTCIPYDVDLNLTIDTLYDNMNLISQLEIDVEIKNDPDRENYYTLEVFEYEKVDKIEIEGDSIENANLVPSANELLSYTESSSSLPLKTLTIFSDKGFDGQDVRTSVNVGRTDILFDDSGRGSRSNEENGPNGETNENSEESKGPRYAIRVMAVSPELYNYIKSFEIYSQQQTVITSNSQPSYVEFNVINGLGIFGGTNVQIIPIN